MNSLIGGTRNRTVQACLSNTFKNESGVNLGSVIILQPFTIGANSEQVKP